MPSSGVGQSGNSARRHEQLWLRDLALIGPFNFWQEDSGAPPCVRPIGTNSFAATFRPTRGGESINLLRKCVLVAAGARKGRDKVVQFGLPLSSRSRPTSSFFWRFLTRTVCVCVCLEWKSLPAATCKSMASGWSQQVASLTATPSCVCVFRATRVSHRREIVVYF